MSYRFVNAQNMHRKHPTTFEVPSIDELNAIKPNSYVKVCHGSERFWIKVTSVTGPIIEGKVDNDLIFKHPFKCGDTVQLRRYHVYSVMDA